MCRRRYRDWSGYFNSTGYFLLRDLRNLLDRLLWFWVCLLVLHSFGPIGQFSLFGSENGNLPIQTSPHIHSRVQLLEFIHMLGQFISLLLVTRYRVDLLQDVKTVLYEIRFFFDSSQRVSYSLVKFDQVVL